MRQLLILAVGLTLAVPVAAGDYPIVPVPFTDVRLASGFWLSRLETNRAVTIPFAFKKCEETGRIDNFAVAGKLKAGTFHGRRYDDSDVYKVIEGASYSLAMRPDAALDASLDGIIAKIAAAQEPDGYLYTLRTILGKDVPKSAGAERWSNLQDSHELYNAGHLYEAAAAHFQATGKHSLLDVALRNTDLLLRTFGEGRIIAVPGHQEIEIGLVKLFRLTGRTEFLDLARFFLDNRGRADRRKLYVYDFLKPPYDRYYSQDFAPVTEQTEAVGHAVRAGYMYSGMADVAALTGDPAYVKALDTIWQNVVRQKMYVTGGVGSQDSGEDFGLNYNLPNAEAYNETCAAIAQMLWNQRMFLLSGDARYLDVLERILYNGFLSGVSLTGDRFFYPNPLASDGKAKFNETCATRVPWFECSCCPTNVVRFLPSLPGYIYAQTPAGVYVNLFIAGQAALKNGTRQLQIIQETDYPWSGDVRLRLNPAAAERFTLWIRIPGWARGEAMPGGLYDFTGSAAGAGPVRIRINGKPVGLRLERGFAVLERAWEPEDVVDLHLPMPVRTVKADENVAADRGKVSFQRGPLVYCAEGVDNGGHALDIVIPGREVLRSKFQKDLLGGIVRLQGDCRRKKGPASPGKLILVPYYAWSHRGEGEMSVWFDLEPAGSHH